MIWPWIVGFFFLIIVGLCIKQSIDNKHKNEMVKVLEEQGFNVTQKFMGTDGNSGIAIDEDSGKIALINRLPNILMDVILYRDIISSEVTVDGNSISKTERGNQLGGAVVGGLLFGGVGAVIGGLSGSKKNVEQVNRIDLNIIINNTKSPIHRVCFLNVECKKSDGIYKKYMNQATHWHALLSAVIRQADVAAAKD